MPAICNSSVSGALPDLEQHDGAAGAGEDLRTCWRFVSSRPCRRPWCRRSNSHRSWPGRCWRFPGPCRWPECAQRYRLPVFIPARTTWPPPPWISIFREASVASRVNSPDRGLVELQPLGHKQRGSAHLANGAGIGHRYPFRKRYFHRATVTFVPLPTSDSMLNSLTRRLLPPRPRPMPEPEVNPSLRACSISGMPGP